MIAIVVMSLAVASAAHQAGGDSPLIFSKYGDSYGEEMGTLVASAGDLDGDGFGEIALCSRLRGAGHPFARVGAVIILSPIDGTVRHELQGNGYQGFGSSVAVIPDFDGDGVIDYLIGARFDTTSGPGAGAVFLHSGASGARLAEFFSPIQNAYFGSSADSAGDIDGDGIQDFMVGAPLAGSVYLISGASGGVLRRIEEPIPLSNLGATVLRVGDLNADGVDDLAASMSFLDKVLVISGLDGSIIHSLEGDLDSGFGSAVSCLEDLNQDGFPDLIVGAAYINARGAVYLYSGLTGELLHSVVGPTTFFGNSRFGESVSGAGDVDGDGIEDFIVGAPGHNPGGMDTAGSAFVYSGRTFRLLKHLPGFDFRADFGTSVSGAGDVDGDGLSDFLVGSPRDDIDVLDDNSGSVHCYSFHPFLFLDQPTLSAANGGTVQLTFRFPAEAALYEYQVLISESGNGEVFIGVDVPLKRGVLLANSYQGIYPFPNHVDMQGTLDASGEATASFHLPSGLPGALIGQTFWFAAIANPIGQLPEYSSIAVPIEILP